MRIVQVVPQLELVRLLCACVLLAAHPLYLFTFLSVLTETAACL
jgi:hypothetical protein